jgi:hypothetical protein
MAEANGERFRDPSAGPDQERRERAVVVGARLEVRFDLVEPKVVQLGPIDRQCRDSVARGCGSAIRGVRPR